MPSITYYENDRRVSANGFSYTQNLHRFHGMFAASNRGRLGDIRELTSRSGNRVCIVITDRVGHDSDYDLATPAARRFFGPRYKVIGRLNCQSRLIGHMEVRKSKILHAYKRRKQHG